MLIPEKSTAAIEIGTDGTKTLVLRLVIDRDNLPGEAEYRKKRLPLDQIKARILGSFGRMKDETHSLLHDLAVSALASQEKKKPEEKPVPKAPAKPAGK
jgi:hypothetical protein